MIRTIQFSPLAEWITIQEEFEAACSALRRCDPSVLANCPAHYVRSTDRFLPVSLLRRSIEDLISCTFEDLRSQPGVGAVKIRNLAALFRRIAETCSGAASDSSVPEGEGSSLAAATATPPVIPAPAAAVPADPADVSPDEWRQWCSRISLHGLESEPLGRLVDSLEDIPRGIWHTPLGRYCELSLDQLRSLKTYGDRRTRILIATFRRLNQLLLASESCPGLTTLLGPELIASADAWAVDVILGRSRFETHCYLSKVIAPLLVQIRHDAGDITYGVLLERFVSRAPALAGLCAPVLKPGEVPWSDRYSTSRLHQYRQEGAAIAAVRWPRGADLCRGLLAKSAVEPGVDGRREVREITTTLFPSLRDQRGENLHPSRSAADAPA